MRRHGLTGGRELRLAPCLTGAATDAAWGARVTGAVGWVENSWAAVLRYWACLEFGVFFEVWVPGF